MVEGVDLVVARRAVEIDRLGEGLVRLEPDRGGAGGGGGVAFELTEQAAPDSSGALSS